MHQLTLQQKIENLEEVLKNRKEKVEKLNTEIQNIESKISKLREKELASQ